MLIYAYSGYARLTNGDYHACFLDAGQPVFAATGTAVSVWVFPFFRHKGIVSDRFLGGKPMVLSNSARARGVAEEPWEVFSAGQAVLVEGYPGSLAPRAVVQRARSLVGTQYDLLRWNCEHLISYAHGLTPKSPQVAVVMAAALIAAMMVLAAD